MTKNQDENQQEYQKNMAAEGLETEPGPGPELDERLAEEEPLPLASGIGRRGTKTSQLLDRAGHLLGVSATSSKPAVEAIAEPESEPVAPSPASVRPRRVQSGGIGRGGVTAIVLLVIFVPLTATLLYLLFDTNTKLDRIRSNLREFNLNANSSKEAEFISILTASNVQTVQFKADDGAPAGRMILYVAGGRQWAMTYGNLEPLEPGQVYQVWLVSKPRPGGEQVFQPLATLPDARTGGNAVVLNQAGFPNGFHIDAYAEVIVTIERGDQVPGDKPAGPRRFSIDATKILST